MKSFSILRTNVGLTTNVKIMVDSSYNLYLESIDSSPELSMSRFKKLQFSKDNYFDELVPYFFKDFPSDISFKIKNSDDKSIMYDKFDNQYDDIYQSGARNIIDNKNYTEEFELFAPLYVFKHEMPNYFVIFRIDGAGLISLTKDNFRSDFLKKLKVVKIFDLTSNTNLGQWLDRSFRKNDTFPTTSLDVNFNDTEFTRWYGVDYSSGGFTYKSKFIGEFLENENTLFDFEKLFFDGFKSNNIIYSQILNMSFLFDDTPSTPSSIRKWSINRYNGFYFDDMEAIDKITPFITPKLHTNIQILAGNILYSSLGDPFVLGYKDDMDMYIEYLGGFYLVVKYTEVKKLSLEPVLDKSRRDKETLKKDEYTNVVVNKYKILADIDLEGKQSFINKKQCYIDSLNRIVNIDSTSYSISNFDLSDMNIIDINGTYHTITKDDDGYLKLVTDYGFNFRDGYRLEYYTNYPDTANYNYIDLSISKSNKPYSFKIYRLKFTDIKDFDTQLVDNNFSKFQYEEANTIKKTEEPKIYTTNVASNSYPKPLNDYIFNGQVDFIPSSSDYNGNFELFRIDNNKLSDIWNKNSVFCRFAYQNSLSNDYYYLLNNSLLHGDFNGCGDPTTFSVERKHKNLDYFYTFNSGTNSYLHHSLHIEKNYDDFQDSSFRFELSKYINTFTYSTLTQSTATYSYDYFSYLFNNEQSYLSNKIISNTRKYSQFNSGDKSISNETLFNGLKFRIFEVDSITKNESSIENINLFNTDKFNDYKFSILFSDNLQSIDNEGDIYDTNRWGYFLQPQLDSAGKLAFRTSSNTNPSNVIVGDIVNIKQSNKQGGTFNGTCSVTAIGSLYSGGYGFITDKDFVSGTTYSGIYSIKMNWTIVRNFEHDVNFKINDIVIYDDILYKTIVTATITDPLINPSNSNYFEIYNASTPFWNPNYTYSSGDWIFKSGEYYYKNDVEYNQSESGYAGDFWYRSRSYNQDDVSIQNGRYYKSNVSNSSIRPNEKSRREDISIDSNKYWSEDTTFNSEISDSDIVSLWSVVGIWEENNLYNINDYIVYNNTLYRWIFDESSTADDIPGQSIYWNRIYSFSLDTDYIYTPLANPIIKISNNYYINTFSNGNTLDSGITIYINKKWKNILVNIHVNDNTTVNIDNIERDYLYSDINTRLTAANFVKQINNLDSKYDFSDYLSYVIIDEDDTVNKYNFSNNIVDIPYFISCETPDRFDVNINSIVHRVSTVDKNIVKPTKELINGQVDVASKVNYYNNIPLGYEIDRNKSNPKLIDMYRHSGPYMPVFYDIDLFSKDIEKGLNGNYKFNEELSLFGIVKQRILSKVNKNGSILKLKENEDHSSIYPMIDEFGYTYADFFIFKSTWDFNYHIETYKSGDITLSNNLFINTILEKNNID